MAEAKTKTTAQKAAPKSAPAPKKSPATKPAAAPKAAAAKKPADAKTAAPKKAAAPRAKKAAAPATLKPGPEELYRMIQTAAYFIAERNGFSGDSKEYWAQAETQILSLINK